jgi:hypothetical protein
LKRLWRIAKKALFLANVKNTYLTTRPPTRVLTNVYSGFVL